MGVRRAEERLGLGLRAKEGIVTVLARRLGAREENGRGRRRSQGRLRPNEVEGKKLKWEGRQIS